MWGESFAQYAEIGASKHSNDNLVSLENVNIMYN